MSKRQEKGNQAGVKERQQNRKKQINKRKKEQKKTDITFPHPVCLYTKAVENPPSHAIS
jgi:hypothetical protein